ncbi:hypothetical protein KCU62_g369, partial [Aureobasidium sp. EXF-3399]
MHALNTEPMKKNERHAIARPHCFRLPRGSALGNARSFPHINSCSIEIIMFARPFPGHTTRSPDRNNPMATSPSASRKLALTEAIVREASR